MFVVKSNPRLNENYSTKGMTMDGTRPFIRINNHIILKKLKKRVSLMSK
jgi:hypothetical protein